MWPLYTERRAVSDLYLDAFRTYERDTADAFEVIRRARIRLRGAIEQIPAENGVEAAAFVDGADPSEPNGAEAKVNAAAHPSDTPGPGRSGPREQGSHGRAARPAPSSPGSESMGTSAPASFPCDQCERTFATASARGIHRARMHQRTPSASREGIPHRDVTPPPLRLHTSAADNARSGSAATRARGPYPCPKCGREFPLPQNVAIHVKTCSGKKDPREIDEDCPRGCGRHFRWEPSLTSHARNCDGKAR
jgi:hypothetical protein